MIYSGQSAAFRRDKHQFFSQAFSDASMDIKIENIDARVENIGYGFLLHNQNTLETEFTQMFAALQKQKDNENKKVFWLYCYYCASLLESFYKTYSQEGNRNKYAQIKQQIKDRLNDHKKHAEPDSTFIQSLQQSFLDGFRNILTAPFHAAQIRDYVAFSNLCRIYWAFCRMTLTQGLSLANELKLIEQLDLLLGTHTDIDKIISTIQAPTFIINYFSVGFFLMRFMIDSGAMIRHAFFPTEKEKGAQDSCEVHLLDDLPGAASLDEYRNSYIIIHEAENLDMELYYIPLNGNPLKLAIKNQNNLKNTLLPQLNSEYSIRLSRERLEQTITAETAHTPETITWADRFKHEFYKRHCNFLNDLVWATVNFLSNFNHLVNISAAVAGYLTAVFLAFDVGMALYKCHLAKEEYLIKKAQYLKEIEDYSDPERYKKMTGEERSMHKDLLRMQLDVLEGNWHTKEATFHFVAAAAAILMTGFTVSMLVNPAVLVLGCYFVCTIAVAMYLSTGSYSQYAEKSYNLEQAHLIGTDLLVAQREYDLARSDFIFTMIKNAVMPLVLITTFAICWPAAIVLTTLYVGYEFFHGYSQHSENNAIKHLALAEPVEEEDECHLPPFTAAM